jgi:hypothetical protein
VYLLPLIIIIKTETLNTSINSFSQAFPKPPLAYPLLLNCAKLPRNTTNLQIAITLFLFQTHVVNNVTALYGNSVMPPSNASGL